MRLFNSKSWFFILVLNSLIFSPLLVRADSFTDRIRQFIHRDPAGYFIHIEDMLGEGADSSFDKHPRYLPNEMNCTTWYQTAIATGLAVDASQVPLILDQIRYFKGIISYATRVHFTDNNVRLKQGLLEPVVFSGVKRLHKSVKLDYPHFKKDHGYACPLYEEKFKTSEVDYYSPDDFLKQSETLEDGVYLMYPVASDHYIELFGQTSGPMGLVHGILLDVDNSKLGAFRAMISHASITRKTVVTKPLITYIQSKATQNFLGYTLWKINPDWKGESPTDAELKEVQPLLDCEKNLK